MPIGSFCLHSQTLFSYHLVVWCKISVVTRTHLSFSTVYFTIDNLPVTFNNHLQLFFVLEQVLHFDGMEWRRAVGIGSKDWLKLNTPEQPARPTKRLALLASMARHRIGPEEDIHHSYNMLAHMSNGRVSDNRDDRFALRTYHLILIWYSEEFENRD